MMQLYVGVRKLSPKTELLQSAARLLQLLYSEPRGNDVFNCDGWRFRATFVHVIG